MNQKIMASAAYLHNVQLPQIKTLILAQDFPHKCKFPHPVPMSLSCCTSILQVAFVAVLESQPPAKARIIKFDRIDLNDGEHYDNTSGAFKCPVKGTYIFSVVMTSRLRSGSGFCAVHLYNTARHLRKIVMKEDPQLAPGVDSGVYIETCNQGESIYVSMEDCSTRPMKLGQTRFFGVLLHAG